ncbi:GNAT family N-acetyltransferase [Geobacillus zalihae]|uniref:GNAT family N-acetyltransferase n=1 Tax=Geobacillus zalihae TaxID=213419 RepID=UPI0009BD7522|nr:GNAT family N-acetyltransferase [Geobacillus zalihae]OQP23871.1 GNAT family N-acetyltransferase [Geobacillus zalihae]
MYDKRLYVFDGNTPREAVIRNYTTDDFADLIRVQQESFPPPFPSELWWNEEQLTNHVTLFPEGALCVEVEGRIVGSMTGLIVDFDPAHADHTWEEITDGGYIGLGKWLMQSMYEVVVHLGLDRLLGGGRMPGYHRHAAELSPEAYIDKVVAGELNDPVITFLLRCGRTPLAIVRNYLEDEESLNHAVLMEWRNPFKQKQGHN